MTAFARMILVSCVLSFTASAEAQLTPPSEGTAVTRPDVMRRVERALFVIEGEAPASFFSAIGSQGRDALLTIVRDVARPVGQRRRAVIALRHYPEPVVRAELELCAASPSEDAILSRYALRSLAAAFGASAFDAVAAALDDDRALVREGAATSLAVIDTARARPLLTARARIEPERFVRETLASLLAR